MLQAKTYYQLHDRVKLSNLGLGNYIPEGRIIAIDDSGERFTLEYRATANGTKLKTRVFTLDELNRLNTFISFEGGGIRIRRNLYSDGYSYAYSITLLRPHPFGTGWQLHIKTTEYVYTSNPLHLRVLGDFYRSQPDEAIAFKPDGRSGLAYSATDHVTISQLL